MAGDPSIEVAYKIYHLIVFVRTHPNLGVLVVKVTNFRGTCIGGDWRLAAPNDFIRGILAGKLDSFRLDFVTVSDERGSVINDYQERIKGTEKASPIHTLFQR